MCLVKKSHFLIEFIASLVHSKLSFHIFCVGGVNAGGRSSSSSHLLQVPLQLLIGLLRAGQLPPGGGQLLLDLAHLQGATDSCVSAGSRERAGLRGVAPTCRHMRASLSFSWPSSERCRSISPSERCRSTSTAGPLASRWQGEQEEEFTVGGASEA